MGQEILYCFKCQERVTSADLDSANALRFGNRTACKKCVPDLLAGLTPQERKELVARVQSPSERKLPAVAAPRPKTYGTTARRRKASGPLPWWAFAGGGALILIAVLIAVSGSGTPPQPRENPPPVSKAPEENPRERAAREALEKAKSLPSSAAEAKLAAFESAVRAAEGTSREREAREMRDQFVEIRKKGLVRELGAVEERARVHLQKEEYGSALAIYEAVRSLHPAPEWNGLVDGKLAELRKAIDAAYAPLKEQAAAARAKGSEEELKSLKERISRWGLAEKSADLEAHLKAVKVAEKELPWIPLFDGKSLSFLTGEGEGSWRLENGAIVKVKDRNSSAQTRREFADGEIRVRFEHRGLDDLGFTIRQGMTGSHGTTIDRVQLRSMEGVEHEARVTFKGAAVSFSLNGNPLPLLTHQKPGRRGHFQFNCHGEYFAVKSVEYREDPELIGLGGHWTFDAVDGQKAADASGNGNDGRLNDAPSLVPGKIGSALLFDGRRSYIAVPSSPSLSPDGPFTISVWVKPAAASGKTGGIVEKWDDAARAGFFLRLNNRGVLVFAVLQPVSVLEADGSKVLPPDEWSHAAAVCDGSGLKLFLNGVLDRNLPGAVAAKPGEAALVIGRGGGSGSHYWSGVLDDVRLYTRALRADEIAKLAVQGR